MLVLISMYFSLLLDSKYTEEFNNVKKIYTFFGKLFALSSAHCRIGWNLFFFWSCGFKGICRLLDPGSLFIRNTSYFIHEGPSKTAAEKNKLIESAIHVTIFHLTSLLIIKLKILISLVFATQRKEKIRLQYYCFMENV